MPPTPSSPDVASAGDSEAPEPRRLSKRAQLALIAACVIVPLVGLGVVLSLDNDDGDADGGVVEMPDGAVAPGRAEVGELAPDFELEAFDGETYRLSDYRGQPVVLAFFASWCNPCEKEFPLLQAVSEERDDVQILAVAHRDLRSDTEGFVERMGTTFPAMPEGSEVGDAYGVIGMPQTFFIDAEGVVRDRVFGIQTQAALDEPLNALLEG